MSGAVRLVVNGRVMAPRALPYVQGDTPMIPLRFAVESLGGEVEWDPALGRALVRWRDRRAEVWAGRDMAVANGQPEQLPEAPRLTDDSLFVPAHFVGNALELGFDWDDRTCVVTLMSHDSQLDGRFIVLDPGHGGRDPGAPGPSGLQEKEVTVDVALRLARLLRLAGASVSLTREDDRYVALADRVAMAGATPAQVFTSLHCNSFSTPAPHGTETYYYETWQGQKLAVALQQELIDELELSDRGVREAGFYVLRHSPVSAALVEIAFISNPSEERFLADAWFRQRASLALFRGIRGYLESGAARLGA